MVRLVKTQNDKAARLGTQCCASGAALAPWDEEKAKKATLVLNALADEARLKILALLSRQEGKVCVCDIVANFVLGQPTISYHLKVLKEAGLVESERRGLWVHYSLNRETLAWLRHTLDGML